MVEGRGRDLDATAPRRRRVRRQHLPEKLLLLAQRQQLIVAGIAALLAYQRRHVFIFQEEFVEPGDLREHLQIGEILRAEGAHGAVQVLAYAAELLEQLAV